MKFYELIHTRCKEGADIEQGRPVSSEGYKEYAFSPELRQGAADLPYIAKAARSAQSYADPNYMPDAYVYHVPHGKGLLGFMLNFHPIPWDKCYAGQNFSNRPGNFINQMLVGDFGDVGFYPYELFGDEHAWTAQQKLGPVRVCGNGPNCAHDHGKGRPCPYPGVAKLTNYEYYYVTPPAELKPREISPKVGKYSFEELGRFIADGRSQALKKAVAFLIEQFGHDNHKERKYLVIKDESTENIEKWIGAIQCAFTPKMAAAIPFATRMEKFETANRYTVNSDGKYQTRVNFQDPSQLERYHAMIVGIDEQDKHAQPVRVMANAPYVLLDGRAKAMEYDAGTTHPYYNLITQFNERHYDFCREFAGEFAMPDKPSNDILKLLEFYEGLVDNFGAREVKASDFYALLKFLSGLKPKGTSVFADIWRGAEGSLVRYLQSDPVGALQIAGWLISQSKTANIADGEGRLVDTVCKVFKQTLFVDYNAAGAIEMWKSVKTDDKIAKHVAKIVNDYGALKSAHGNLFGQPPENGIGLLIMFLDACDVLKTKNNDALGLFVRIVIHNCKNKRSQKDVAKILDLLGEAGPDGKKIMLSAADDATAHFTVECLIDLYDIEDSDDNMVDFCKSLTNHGLDGLIILALRRRFGALNHKNKKDYQPFLIAIKPYGKKSGAIDIYQDVDEALADDLLDGNSHDIAKIVSAAVAGTSLDLTSCAHILALYATESEDSPKSLAEELDWAHSYGFPSVTTPKYISKVIEGIYGVDFNNDKEPHRKILEILAAGQKAGYFYEYAHLVCKNLPKTPMSKWVELCAFAAKSGDEEIEHDFVLALKTQNIKTVRQMQEKVPRDFIEFFEDIIHRVEHMRSPKKARKKSEEISEADLYDHKKKNPISGLFRRKNG